MPAKKAVKKVVKKVTVKKVAPKTVVKKVIAVKVKEVKTTTMEGSLKVALFDKAGKQTGTVKLPETVFGGKINPVLMAQAVRVYLANQRMGAAKTKTRGQVDGSTRKIYRQKGTGRARHGGIRAPIFVGGGIAHGPQPKDFSLTLPAKMKKAAVVSALSEMAKNNKVVVVSGLSSMEPKTKIAAKVLMGIGLSGKKALVVMPSHVENVVKAVRNIDRAEILSASMLNTYEVLNAGTLVVMQEALEVLEKQLKKEKK